MTPYFWFMLSESSEQHINYQRIAESIRYMSANYTRQPKLDELADLANVSPYHFQRLFTEWVGVSPKKFMQCLSIRHAKEVLRRSESTLFETAHEIGLSGTGRLHDLFISIEAMTPGEFKQGAKGLTISYDFVSSRFGQLIVANTTKGVCFLGFIENKEQAVEDLVKRYTNGHLINQSTVLQQPVKAFFLNMKLDQKIHLHLSGTPFQLKVWETLLRIPNGNLATYKSIAQKIEKPMASRAVGTAIGANPIAYLIPCHRVIQATGNFGGYMWGAERKRIILGWEGVTNE